MRWTQGNLKLNIEGLLDPGLEIFAFIAAISQNLFQACPELLRDFQQQGFGSGAFQYGKERKFWFQLDAELIVYGATEPNARVTLQGEPVKLRPDGTFKDEMNLVRGYWEAKDPGDNLNSEIAKKKKAGYPFNNIIFEDNLQRLWDSGRCRNHNRNPEPKVRFTRRHNGGDD